LIGLVPAIHNMSWQLPQLFTAGWLADAAGFEITFILSVASGRLMAAALWFAVKDSVAI